MNNKKAEWEKAVAKALREGDANFFTPDIIKLALAKEGFTAPTDGARAANLKALAMVESMLVQVTKDDGAERTDEQIAKGAARQFASLMDLTPEEEKAIEGRCLAKLAGAIPTKGNGGTSPGAMN